MHGFTCRTLFDKDSESFCIYLYHLIKFAVVVKAGEHTVTFNESFFEPSMKDVKDRKCSKIRNFDFSKKKVQLL